MRGFFYVYILSCWKSRADMERGIPIHGHVLYTGYTNDIVRRLKQHVNGHRFGKRPSYTSRFNGNLKLRYLEVYDNKPEALDREREIKKRGRQYRVRLIDNQDDYTRKFVRLISDKIRQKTSKKIA